MAFLKKTFVTLGGLVLFLSIVAGFEVGCTFDPLGKSSFYPPCKETNDCPGGFVCLDGLCAPDCTALDAVAWVVPGPDDQGKWMCSKAENCRALDEGIEASPARVEANLQPDAFLDLGPQEGATDPGCDRVVINFSLLALKTTEGRELSVVIRGRGATGVVVGPPLALESVDGYGDPEAIRELFMKNSYFFTVSTSNFPWPVEVRLLPFGQSLVSFALRGFVQSCCKHPGP